jgi:hypothetical protein
MVNIPRAKDLALGAEPNRLYRSCIENTMLYMITNMRKNTTVFYVTMVVLGYDDLR